MTQCRVLLLAISILGLLSATAVDAYQTFQTNIPNGDKVPNPCLPGTAWPGVGHLIPGGSGDRNPFGRDFAEKRYNWTAVCPLDSDQDGRTNGQELGDPTCTWTTGKPAPSSSNITHPGICEPLDSPICTTRNAWLKCSPKFNCPATNNSDVRQLALRFPPTPVPANETTYICYGFKLPNDTDYHIIALTPFVNTSQIMHHMLLFACTDMKDESILNQPETCGMAPDNCNTLIGVWGVGLGGYCARDEFGFLMGVNGFKYAILQLHWNNPGHVTNFVDSSGMTLHYTRNLRPNSAAVLLVGQLNLNIPPGLKSVSFNGSCSKRCSSALPRSLYLTDAILHMHLLGASGYLQLYRNGMLNKTFVNDTDYDYNTQELVQFPAPVTFQPGDELRVGCTFDSTSRTTTTHYGEATNNEMCFGFFTYYPVIPNFINCMQWRDVDQCGTVPPDCGINDFFTILPFIQKVCTSMNCSRACKTLMTALVDTGCMTGNIGDMLAAFGVVDTHLLAQLAQQCGLMTPGGQQTTTHHPPTTPTSAATTSLTAATSVLGVLFAITFYLIRFVTEP